MKKNLLAALMFGAALVSGSAFATDGTINMTGSLTASTCKINGVAQNGTSVTTLTFPLGTYSTSSFATAGTVGPMITNSTSGQVILSSCPVNQAVTLVISPGTAAVDATNNAFQNTTTGGATNVEAQILNAATGTVLVPTGTGAATSGISSNTGSGGSTTFSLGARFIATGQATAGQFTSNATFNILYQ